MPIVREFMQGNCRIEIIDAGYESAKDSNRKRKIVLDGINVFLGKYNLSDHFKNFYFRLMGKNTQVAEYASSTAASFNSDDANKGLYGMNINYTRLPANLTVSYVIKFLRHELVHALQHKHSNMLEVEKAVKARIYEVWEKSAVAQYDALGKKGARLFSFSNSIRFYREILANFLSAFLIEGMARYFEKEHPFTRQYLAKDYAKARALVDKLNGIFYSDIRDTVLSYSKLTLTQKFSKALGRERPHKERVQLSNCLSYGFVIGAHMCYAIDYANENFRAADFLKFERIGFVKAYEVACSKLGIAPLVGINQGIFNYNKYVREIVEVYNKYASKMI
jgi:hypothetical protein